ncbi:GntR family transcriptional regulator [Humitalea sp. 24SJ18S-53]|uniref:GntR family transcriptional regulator n=1 Tax=Humitalea sp. 24SJ18S-53 TaxID=3422307 RepID=UPI003D66902F
MTPSRQTATPDEDMFGRAEPLHMRAYDLLWLRLEAGELAAGMRLKDTDWAIRLGVSRTPVREALRKLAHDGALDALGAGGYQVHLFTAAEIGDLYRCRSALESLAAEEAARHGGAPLAATLAGAIAQAAAALERDDLAALQGHNSTFHDAILMAAASPYLRRLLDQARRLSRMARRQLLALALAEQTPRADYRAGLARVLDDHRAMQHAFAAADAQKAGALMRAHLLATARDMGAQLPAV